MLRFSFIVFLSFLVVGCTREAEKYKRPVDIFVLAEPLNRNKNSYLEYMSTAPDYVSADTGADEVIEEILSKRAITFPVYLKIMNQLNQTGDDQGQGTASTKSYQILQIKNLLLLKSDRICKSYLDYILDTSTSFGIGQKIAQGLPNFLAEFISPTHSITNASRRLAIVADALETGFSSLGLEENYFKNTAKDIVRLRQKMRSTIEHSIGDTANYPDYDFYIDLERYHNSCSIYDRILYNRTDVQLLEELAAYKHLGEAEKLKVLEL